jgi:hypothetical protein
MPPHSPSNHNISVKTDSSSRHINPSFGILPGAFRLFLPRDRLPARRGFLGLICPLPLLAPDLLHICPTRRTHSLNWHRVPPGQKVIDPFSPITISARIGGDFSFFPPNCPHLPVDRPLHRQSDSPGSPSHRITARRIHPGSLLAKRNSAAQEVNFG